MHDTLEFLLPLITGALALIPLTILLIAYRRTKSRRIMIASITFLAFFVKGILLASGLFIGGIGYDEFEWMEFGSDLMIIILFTASFLVGTGGSHEAEDFSEE
ncbi:MAG: hypothetical protein ACE5QF_07710 [Thermoplasmata archaeon]